MLSRDTRLRLQEILARVASDQPVSLSERIYIHKFADRNQTVATWLHRARREQQKLQPRDGIDQLLDGLELGERVVVDTPHLFRDGQRARLAGTQK